MDAVSTLLFLITAILSFLLGKYYRKLLPFLDVFGKNSTSIDLKKLSLDCSIGMLEDDISAHSSHLKFFLQLSRIGIWQYRINDGKLQINSIVANIFGFEEVESLKLETFLKLILFPEDIKGLARSFNGGVINQEGIRKCFSNT
jgi:PAS domain-containing protein